jgi:vesicle transport through interaction with t-SNAREs protein 1
MANPLDTDVGTELFHSYEAEYKLVQAELVQKLDQIPELAGEPRKAALSAAERAMQETKELLDQMQLEKQSIPSSARGAINRRLRDYASDVDGHRRKLRALSDDRAALFGARFSDNPDGGADDANLEQRQQLLAGTERLERSSGRLRESQRVALETEEIGRNTLADLGRQRETIERTRVTLQDSEGYTDRSIKTLRGMARRYCLLPAVLVLADGLGWLQIG